jgi:hypothetical protein
METENEINATVESDFDRPEEYYDNIDASIDEWKTLAKVKDQTTALYDKRWQSAKLVIDAIARRIGIDPETCGLYLYAPDNAAGESEMLRRLDEYFDRSGDKVKLKRRIDELERENTILRSLVHGK